MSIGNNKCNIQNECHEDHYHKDFCPSNTKCKFEDKFVILGNCAICEKPAEYLFLYGVGKIDSTVEKSKCWVCNQCRLKNYSGIKVIEI